MAIDAARAKSLFLAASDLADPAERAAFLERECGPDSDLRARVEALLRANDAAPLPVAGGQKPGFLEKPGFYADAQPETEDYGDPAARVGAILAGKYKLVEEIGEGGMGTVFMAQQTEPVKRAVAVKIIKAGMDSRAVLARFEAERQALAMMDHPNIAKVLDAGTVGDSEPRPIGSGQDSPLPIGRGSGRPFFVMELVKGTPITRYCDEHRLTPRQRLELFVPVCQAIQHAHQKGIIHRDIKPSNVLVAMYDDRPVPKVIDFGVAKAAGQTLTDKTLMTGFGALVGTPEYMSPEQASLNNLDIDTRSDVYSLGVLLYELLTGTTPVDKKSLGKAAILEILRIVREVEAPRPSAKLSTIDTLPSVAANRGTEPAKLSRLMKGELDWLVLKALEKDRTRRYETANALARDIQRYLADEVVEARPPSVRYRVSKFVRRHKGQVIAASLVLLALLAGITGTTIGLFQAESARRDEAQQRAAAEKAAEAESLAKRDAETRRQEAERNLAFAKKGNEILGSVFAGLDPNANYATVAELRNALRDNLNKAVKDLEGSAIGEPLEVAAMQDTLGRSLCGLGEGFLAVEVLQKALATFKAKLGPDDTDTLTSMIDLAWAYQHIGQVPKAVTLYEETLAKCKAKFGPDHLDTLHSMNNLAIAYRANGQIAQSVTLLEETFVKLKAKPDLKHPELLFGVMDNLARAYEANGQLAKAMPLFEEALAKTKAKFGPDHPSTLICMSHLAFAYLSSGQVARAVPLFEESLEKRKAQLGPDHPNTLASMDSLALAYQASGQLAKAVPLFEEALAKQKAKLGPDHPDTLGSMYNLAGAYRDSGQLAKAVPLYEETLEKHKAKLGPDHPNTLLSMNNLAAAYWKLKRLNRSIPLFEEALKRQEKQLGRQHPDTLLSLANLGVNYRDAGRLVEAIPLLEEALEKMKAKLGPDQPDMLSCMNNLAGAYKDSGQPAKSVPLLEETLEKRKAKLGPDHPDTLETMNNLAVAYQESGQLTKAMPLIEETLEKRKAKLGPDHSDTLTSMNNLAAAYWRLKRLDRSIPLLEEAVRRREKLMGRQHPDTLLTMANLGVNYKDAGRLAEAIPLLEETLEKLKAKLGSDHPDTLFSMKSLAVAYRESGQLAKAVPLLEETLEKRKAKLGPDHPDTLDTINSLAVAYQESGQLAKAMPLLEETLEKRKAKLGPDHPDTLTSMNSLAVAYWKSKSLNRSIPLFEETLRRREKLLGRQHPDTLLTVANLGVNYRDAGRLAKAIPLLEESYAASKKDAQLRGIGPELVDAYLKSGKETLATKLMTQLIADLRERVPKDSPQLAAELARYSQMLLQAKAFPDAEPLLRDLLAMRLKHIPDSWLTFNAQSMLGGALLGQKKYAEAEPLLVKGYEEMKTREKTIPKTGGGELRIPEALDRLIELYTAINKPDEAKKWQAERDKYRNTNPR
jgi:serine/threonine protein kinase